MGFPTSASLLNTVRSSAELPIAVLLSSSSASASSASSSSASASASASASPASSCSAGTSLQTAHRCGGLPLRAFSGLRRGTAPPPPNSVKVQRPRPKCIRHSTSNIRCDATKVKLRMKLDHQVRFGQEHALLGSSPSLGSWTKKVPMQWSESGWVVDLEIDNDSKTEFKFVIVLENGDLIWEDGPNRVLELPEGGTFELYSKWNDTKGSIVKGVKEEHDGNGSASAVQTQEEESLEIAEISSDATLIEDESIDELPSSSSFVQEWQGRNISFMRSNEHNREKKGKWDVSGLEGSAVYLVDGDRTASNWWRKLEVVINLITNDLNDENRLDTLINISIYLKWINTGQIQCFEDGGHHRPNRHAEISRRIFRELERMIGKNDLLPQELIVIRKIHPSLPSFKAEFTASVPLTRIRDIAHRNDIPHNLKQEIKHTIQNKLHRNAGPEDLVATELMLGRITKNPGEYSAAFVEEFKIFFKELKDFFNAGSLTEQLDSIRPSLDDVVISLLEDFLTNKKKLDKLEEPTSTDTLIGTMHALTGLRAGLLKGLETGLRNDASDDAIAMRQKWRLCEIGLEDYLFVLLSRFSNTLEQIGGSVMLAQEACSKKVESWNHPFGAIVLGIRNVGLSGFKQQECMAIENEIIAWQSAGMFEKEGNEDGTRIWALRVKATIERARRLSEAFSDLLLQIYPKNVEKLGNALGIPENTVRCYTEAEIRSSVVFQLSKLCSLLLKAARATAGLEGWDPLVSGEAVGRLVEVDKIIPEALSHLSGPIILLVKEADGDEEVKASGENVQGVILLQELPHLSHLGVRARQEKVVFVTCEDEDKIANLRGLIGQNIRLEVGTDSATVHMQEQSQEDGSVNVGGSSKESSLKATSSAELGTAISSSKVVLAFDGSAVDLASAEIQTCGAKAYSCGLLAQLSLEAKPAYNEQGVPAAFEVPAGLVIPFGAMEAALEASGGAPRFRELVAEAEKAEVKGGRLDRVCKELQELVAEQRPTEELVAEIGAKLGSAAAGGGGGRLIVRSSANVEDLAGMSGAGLYESVAGVNAAAGGAGGFGRAVARVWASLYTRRAVLSRRAARVAQKDAAMAVLVQELVAPQLSFVLHTVCPAGPDGTSVAVEIAPGLGETLASAARGSAWRLSVGKLDGLVRTHSFANFSDEMLVLHHESSPDGSVRTRTVDYTRLALSTDSELRSRLAQRLATVGFFLEQRLGAPQDIEGCIVGDDTVYIVQSRPQPL